MVASTALASAAPVAAAVAPADTAPAELARVDRVDLTAVRAAAVSTIVAHRIPAGWYPDRENPVRRRWWDGTNWTEHYTCPTGAVTVTPRHAATSADRAAASAANAAAARPGAPRRIPVLVTVLLAGLTGANVVLLSLLAAR